MTLSAVGQRAKRVTYVSCMFVYMTMRIVHMGLVLAWLIHIKPRYISYCEGVANANNVWKHV